MEKKIKFDEVIAFIRRAINSKYIICLHKFGDEYYFSIIDNKYKEIRIDIYNDHFNIMYPSNKGYIRIKHNMTERDRVIVEGIYLDAKDLNEEKAIKAFDEFFFFRYSEKEVITNIDSLNDDD